MTNEEWWEIRGGECDKIIDDGKSADSLGHSYKDNPYQLCTKEHDAWRYGFMDSHRN
jgi:hypothetical protein